MWERCWVEEERDMQYREHLIGLGLADETVRIYEMKLRRAQRWAREHDVDLLSLLPSQARAMSEEWPKSSASRRQLLAALRHYWSLHGVAGPESAIIVPKPPRSRWRGLDDRRVRRLLAASKGDWPRGGAVFVGIYLGIRRAAIAKLRWGDFDEEFAWVTVYEKRDVVRQMPVHPDLQRMLASHRGTGYVFPGRHGGHVATATINLWISSIAEDAGIGHFTPHQMRHTSGGKVYEATGDIYLVAEWLGHADVQTSKVYTRVGTSRLMEAMGAHEWEDDEDASEAA